MKKSLLFFLTVLTATISLHSRSNNPQAVIEKQKHAALQATCTINILKAKLSCANQQHGDLSEISSILQALYHECSSVINSPDINDTSQPTLTESDWVNKSIGEITFLHQDHSTRNCFNQAMNNLQQLSPGATQEEKDTYIKNFLQESQNCSYQHAQRLSLDHLNAQIDRWNKNKEKQEYDVKIWSTFLKHTPDQKADLQADVQKLYDTHFQEITFDEFASNIKSQILKIKHNPHARPCLENIFKFTNLYEAAQTQEEKEVLKKDFAIPYFQCKKLSRKNG